MVRNNNKRNNHINLNYKTLVCRFWKDGDCIKGNSCEFAHGEQDIRLRLCKAHFIHSNCKWGEECLFSHVKFAYRYPRNSEEATEDHNLQKKVDIKPNSQNSKEATDPTENNQNLTKISDDTKIILCPYFSLGKCVSGQFCRYKHDLNSRICEIKNPLSLKSMNKRKQIIGLNGNVKPMDFKSADENDSVDDMDFNFENFKRPIQKSETFTPFKAKLLTEKKI